MLKPMATILIVEDDALLQDALTGQLKQLNYGVCTATSVAQGMAVLQDQAVDGIILDLGLPDADGLDLLTWARTRIVGLPVLILTARDGIDAFGGRELVAQERNIRLFQNRLLDQILDQIHAQPRREK